MKIEEFYLSQLQKYYHSFLSNLIQGKEFEVIKLWGGKKKPTSTKQLHELIASFQLYEKNPGKLGWVIEWEIWRSRLVGVQQWPTTIIVNSEADFLFLLKKEEEVTIFRKVAQQILNWNPSIRPWLVARPQKVLELEKEWGGICAVVDYILRNEVRSYYLRSLPVPVHTKFIQQHKATLLSLLQHFDSLRFAASETNFEKALLLQEKPALHTTRWLDTDLATCYTSSIDVFGISPLALQKVDWVVEEIWVVENETNVFLLPKRKKTMAIFSKGYALHQFKNIPLFQKAKLIYWGDLDEDGFIMLHQFRQYYPHVRSAFMDETTVLCHMAEMSKIPFRRKLFDLQLLPNEAAAYKLLMEFEGRIEQEQLQQQFIQAYLDRQEDDM